MRTITAAVLVSLVAVSAAAQVVSSEITTDPLPPRQVPLFAAPAVALARDSRGVAVAWTMLDGPHVALFVVRLDANAHFAGAPAKIATPAADADIIAPSIAPAPNGTGFVVGWLEWNQLTLTGSGLYTRLDASLRAGPTRVLPLTRRAPDTPVVVRSGATTMWIAFDTSVWKLRADGGVDDALNAGVTVTDMTISGDVPRVVSAKLYAGPPNPFTCDAAPNCSAAAGGPFRGFCTESCRRYKPTYTITFVALYSSTSNTVFSFASEAQPAVSSDGHDVFVAWMSGAQATGGSVLAARFDPLATPFASALLNPLLVGTFRIDAGPTRPDVATDGERYVAVWRSVGADTDVVGAMVDRAGRVTPLSIATSSADERDPAVVAMGEGRFLVAYESVTGGERRLAGRIVSFPVRERAVR